MSLLFRLSPFVFLQLVCVGANLSTLERYNAGLGGGEVELALLWMAYMGPRAVMTPFWAALSDRFGRRPIILIGGIGQILASGLYAVGGAWWVLLVSRLLDSTTSAHGAIAHSIVADVTTPEKRSAGMGMVGALVSLAFIAGPVLGAHTAETLGYRALGLGFVLLQGASLISYALLLPETAPKWKPRAIEQAARTLRERLPARPVLVLLGVALLASAGTFSYYASMPLAANRWFGWEELEAGKAFALLGFVGALVQGGLIRPLVPRFGEERLIVLGLALAAAGLVVGATGTLGGLWTATVLVAAGSGFVAPSLGGLLSRRADAGRQGLVLGLYQSMTTLGRGVGPGAAALATLAGPGAAFLLGAIFCIAAAIGVRIPRPLATKQP